MSMIASPSLHMPELHKNTQLCFVICGLSEGRSAAAAVHWAD